MANPATGMAGAAYGYADMGPYARGLDVGRNSDAFRGGDET